MSAPKSDNSPQPTEPESTSAAGEPAGETASPRDAGEREEASSTTPARVSEEVAEHTRSGPVEGSEGASTKVSVADDDGDSSSKEAAGASVEAAPASPEEAESAESPSSLEPASPQSVNEGPEPAGAEQVDGSSAAFGSDSPEAAEGSAAASGSDSPDADDASDTTPLDRTEVDRASESTSRLPARIELRYAGATAVGLVREHNEDNLLMANLTTSKRSPRHQTCVDHVGSRGSIFAVCDGMGGAAAGEVASQLAVDTVFEELSDLQGSEDRDAFAQALISTVERAGRRIFQTAKEDHSRQGMGTTATVAGLVDQVLFVAQVGDSRAYLLRHGEVKRITKDQSLVNQLIEAGHLTVEEAEAFEHSNIILQALGTTEAVQVDLTFAELRRGDRLLLCSDGLCGLVNDDAVAHTITTVDDPSECCGKLIDQANAAGGHDNITVIVADFEGEALVKPKPTDTVGYV
ncbi:MAG: Stp1/IreP family PP2C-type Ser/Thr phosphatase, partial [Proteobacteria bacterium]|nr:Stp1/IreP family PP2C-type Ser/Thr phosphatase [Pseudomonadota bacterium]